MWKAMLTEGAPSAVTVSGISGGNCTAALVSFPPHPGVCFLPEFAAGNTPQYTSYKHIVGSASRTPTCNICNLKKSFRKHLALLPHSLFIKISLYWVTWKSSLYFHCEEISYFIQRTLRKGVEWSPGVTVCSINPLILMASTEHTHSTVMGWERVSLYLSLWDGMREGLCASITVITGVARWAMVPWVPRAH